MKIEIKKLVKAFIFLVVISFLGLYFAYSNGYYEKMQEEKMNLTNQMIEQFEQDIKDGKDVSIESYLQDEKSYATKTSKASLNISSKLSGVIDSGIKFIFRKIGNMVE